MIFLFMFAFAMSKTPTVKPSTWSYDSVALKAIDDLGKGLMTVKAPSDMDKFCPTFQSLSVDKKKMFYVTLLREMARYESRFDNAETYTESFKDANGVKVVSRGLLQISIESANGRSYACGIKKAQDLHDPETNLRCGVKILNKWVVQDNRFGGTKTGGGRYWSVLWATKKLDLIASVTKQLCLNK